MEVPQPPPPNNSMMNFIVWNCRGAQSLDFCRNFRSMLNYHSSSLVVLVGTHITDHHHIRDDFQFTHMAEVSVVGHARGITIFWSQDTLIVDTIAMTQQEVHCMIQVIPQQYKWMFSAIYASPHAHNRTILWENIRCIYDHYKGPWLLVGDFNKILSSSEKFGGQDINNNRSNQFLNCLNYCNLTYLGFKGSRYTWTNNCKCGSTILECWIDA